MNYEKTHEHTTLSPVKEAPSAPALVTIPVDHICIHRKAYDDLQGRLNSLKNDFYDELKQQIAETRRLQQLLDEKANEIAALKGRLEGTKKELKETAYKLFTANETILTLQKEIALLNEELCEVDRIEEVAPHAVAEDD